MNESKNNKGYERKEEKTKKVKTRIIWGIIIVAIAASLIVCIFRKKESVAPIPDPVVMVQPPVTGNIELTVNLIGTTEPVDIVYIYPKAGGDVTVVNVEAGDTVVAGQVLVEIDIKQVATPKNAMDTAKVAWDDVVSTLNRMTPPYASGFVSNKEFGGRQTAAEVKRLQYESVKIGYETQMEFSHVISPIDGRVEQLNVELHDTMGSSMQMRVTTGEGGNNVTFHATEKMKNNPSLGAPVTVTKEGNQCGDSVAEINNTTEASVGLFKVKVSMDDQETTVPGTSVEIQAPSASARNVMSIPNHCVYYKSGDAYVYMYDQAEGMIHEVPVEIGIFDSENISVPSGLTLDDVVLATWTSELKEGIKITLDTGAGEDVRQTDEVESPAVDTSAAQWKEVAKWA